MYKIKGVILCVLLTVLYKKNCRLSRHVWHERKSKMECLVISKRWGRLWHCYYCVVAWDYFVTPEWPQQIAHIYLLVDGRLLSEQVWSATCFSGDLEAVLKYHQQEAFEKCWAHSPLRAIHQVSLLSHAVTVARRLRIDVHNNNDNNDNAWQRGPLWPHRMGPINSGARDCEIAHAQWRRWELFGTVRYFILHRQSAMHVHNHSYTITYLSYTHAKKYDSYFHTSSMRNPELAYNNFHAMP